MSVIVKLKRKEFVLYLQFEGAKYLSNAILVTAFLITPYQKISLITYYSPPFDALKLYYIGEVKLS